MTPATPVTPQAVEQLYNALLPSVRVLALASILETAIEQGSAYWANWYKSLRVSYYSDGGLREFCIGNPIKGTEAETPPMRRVISAAAMLQSACWLLLVANDRTIPAHAKVTPSYAGQLLGEILGSDDCGPDIDAGGADILLQVAVFGRVIYG